MSCDNLCTAAKCAELEIRINALESVVQFLMAELDAHKSLDIPSAHDYKSNLKIDGSFQSETLTITVADETSQDTATISIPDDDVTVSLAADSSANTLKVFVKVGNKSDDETVNLPKFEPDVDVALAVDSGANTLKAFVKVGNKSDEDTVKLPDVNPNDWLDLLKNLLKDWLFNGIKDYFDDLLNNTIRDLIKEAFDSLLRNLSISSNYYGDNLQICVSNGVFSDCTTVYIPRGGGGGGGGNGYEETTDFLTGSGALTDAGILKIFIDSSIGNAAIEIDMSLLLKIERLLIEIADYNATMYKILGGGVWTELGDRLSRTVSLEVNPETKIKTIGQQLYEQDSNQVNQLTATNLLDLANINEAVNFHRNGFHRLPATTLKSLINNEDGNQQITIYDTFSWQEYLIKQVDALIGEFPIKIKHQTLDANEQEVEIDLEINNISVAIAEILALNLGITHDADTAINIGMKTLVEARNAANAAIVGIDYAKANAQYLGYKGNQKQREVNCTFTPNATNLRKALKPSEQKVVGWENEDNETLLELIKKTLIGTEIIKAALFHPYEDGSAVTGDAIKNNLDAEASKNDTDWEEFKARINNPSGRYLVPKPKANIRDLTIDEPTP